MKIILPTGTPELHKIIEDLKEKYETVEVVIKGDETHITYTGPKRM